ncbi:MAG TPA: CDP-alcohol phosphatidyltransferase family protein [Pseudomonadota bacterium]|nr:CDP-alcohol phosphatidyltransferase family protein [Pseudomonadota bacterium]
MGKPPITANQVTLLRIVLLPLGPYLLYGNPTEKWLALLFMAILGCTDFIDGWLARRYGSTELGRLMDPIADKAFVLVSFLPFIHLMKDDHPWLYPWQVGLLLSREYVITSLRSMYEQRRISPKTPLLAKIKAWAQMAGSGVIFLLRMVPEHWILYAIILGSVLPVVALLIRYAVRRVVWKGALIFGGWFFVLLPIQQLWGSEATAQFLTVTIIGITWISGFTYITPLFPLLRKGELRAGDWMRLFGSIVPPTLLLILQTQHVLRPWVVMLIMAIELSVSGLDNLLCFHRVQASAALWGARVGLITLLCALVLAGQPASLLYVALALSVGLSAIEFYRGRRYYLEEPENAKQRVVD